MVKWTIYGIKPNRMWKCGDINKWIGHRHFLISLLTSATATTCNGQEHDLLRRVVWKSSMPAINLAIHHFKPLEMYMKHALTFFCLVALSSVTQAQWSWGVEGAAVFSKAKTNKSYPGADIELSSNARTGFMGGLIVDIPFGDEKLRLMPELVYNQLGVGQHATASLLGQNVTLDQHVTVGYASAIVNLALALPVGDQKFLMGVGPYLGVGTTAKRWYKLTPDASSSLAASEKTESIAFGSGTDQLKRMDYGINVMGGFMLFNGLTIKASYGFGLAELSNDPNVSYKNRYFSVGLAYFFH